MSIFKLLLTFYLPGPMLAGAFVTLPIYLISTVPLPQVKCQPTPTGGSTKNPQLCGLAWHTRAPTAVAARPYSHPCQGPAPHISAPTAIMAQPE